MMDPQMIKAITNVIKQSNMSDLNLISVEVRPETIIDKCGKYETCITLSDYVSLNKKAQMSEAWVAGNILLFTLFDGYLENKYNLLEGVSFREHYNNLPSNSQLERIEKDCYRILKIIRNAIQHNLNGVIFNNGSYSISYTFRNINYKLNINNKAMRYLYTIILNIINDEIYGLDKRYRTDGHYIGMINFMYSQVRSNGTLQLSDDIAGDLLGNIYMAYDSSCLRTTVRYPIKNPVIVSDDDNAVIFYHIENNGTDDETSNQYQYSTDYQYQEYLLP